MIPISLNIKGLYSYQKEQAIDFKKLTDAHLFGIFGSVGCGKSSILEAITYALYGKTERLNLSGDNRNYNMMNLKSDEMSIEFRFDVGELEYLATVSSKRNKKRFEDVKKADRMLYENKNGQWEAIEPDEIESILGLNYDNFKRTIIIPQGKFQDFLQLGDKDRTQMMKELFKLEKFELGGKVGLLEKENENNIKYVTGQLQEVGEVKKEQLDEISTVLKDKEQALNSAESIIKEKQETHQELQKLKEKIQELNELKKQLTSLSDQKEAFEKLEQQLEQFDYCKEHFKPLLDEAEKLSQRRTQIESEIKSGQKKQEEQKETLKKAEVSLAELKPQHEQKEALLEKAQDYLKWSEIKQAQNKIKENSERIKKGEKVCSDNDQSLTIELKKQEEALKSREKLSNNQADLSTLNKIKEWFLKLELFEKELFEKSKELEDLKLKTSKTENDFVAFKRTLFNLGVNETDTPSDTEANLKAYILEQEKLLTSLDEKIAEETVQQKLSEFANQLKEGVACPLCGSEHHPHLYTTEESKHLLEKLENEKKQAKELINKADEHRQKAQEFRLNIQEQQKQFVLLSQKVQTTEKELKQHKTQFTWEEYQGISIKELQETISKAEQNQKEINLINEQLGTIMKNLSVLNENKEKFRRGLDILKSEKDQQESKIETLSNQLKHVKEADIEGLNELTLKEKAKNQELQYQELIQAYEKNEKLIQTLKLELNTTETALKEKQQVVSQVQFELESNTKALTEHLGQSEFESFEEVSKVLKQNLDTKALRNKITEYKKQLFSIEEKVKGYTEALKDKPYNEEAHKLLIEELNNLVTQQKELQKEYTTLQLKKKELLQKLEKSAKLHEELDALTKREENLKLLKKLFKGSGFVNYVSSVHLQNLCNAANARFHKMTGQSLQLELTDENNFRVRDFLNGGKTRSVKTLSGGQTFQAALSLALALADNICQLTNASRNFFFLDEGFGSLDKESLRIVFETLKSLQKENRIVGVISHVEELQQEIPVHLKIEKHKEDGSLVQCSWQEN